MNLDELDAIYREAGWLIAKRSGWTALKALTIGKVRLDDTVSSIADMYDLTTSERRKLRPSIAHDLQDGVANAVNLTRGAGVTVNAANGAKMAQVAWKHGRVAKAAMTLVTHGPKAAKTFANTGRVVGKANPVIAVATAAYAVGTTGWFAYHAHAFNRAAYELVKARTGVEGDADGEGERDRT